MKHYWRVGVWTSYTVILGIGHFKEMWIGWFLGVGIAAVILLLDRLLYAWWLKPYEQLSIQIQYWIKKRDLGAVWKLLYDRGNEQTTLILHSVGFAVLWPLLTIYVLTSTGSVIAAGIMMSLGLNLAEAIMHDWGKPQQLARWFCWQIKRPCSNREVKILTGSYLFVWILFSLVLLVK